MQHLGHYPHTPYDDLGFSFKKTLKRIKTKAKQVAAKKSVTPKAVLYPSTSSWYKKITTDPRLVEAVKKAKKRGSQVKASKSSYFKRLKAKAPTKLLPPTVVKLLPKSTRIEYQRQMVAENKARIARERAARYKKMKAESKKAQIKRLPKAQAVPGPRGRSGPMGQEGKRGTRGYPGTQGQRGPIGPRGESVSTTVRWRHKLEKDRLNRALLNQQRLGRERAELQKAHVAELSNRNAILLQRISEQEQIAAKVADEKTIYKQWKSLKDNAEATIFPTLAGIDIDDEPLAMGVSILPWAIIVIALITREG